MKLDLECIVCLVRQALKVARLATSDEAVQENILRHTLSKLLNSSWDVSTPRLAHEVYRIIREVTGVNDPYAEIKKRSNDEALSIYQDIKDTVWRYPDPLEAAVRLAIAGNIIDFAVYDSPNVKSAIDHVLKAKPAINDYPKLREELLTADTLLYFVDNAGEIVFDKVLLETLIRIRGKPFSRLTVVAKGGPIINDATLDDLRYVGFTDLPNVSFKTISNGDPGSGPERDDPEVVEWVREHDVTIAKGQGNYEGLSEIKGIYFLLIVKCPVVARYLGVSTGDVVIKYNC